MNSVNDNQYVGDSGPFEARYLAFLETISARVTLASLFACFKCPLTTALRGIVN
jgi:hypothetical protein